jgi:hypothetical protein
MPDNQKSILKPDLDIAKLKLKTVIDKIVDERIEAKSAAGIMEQNIENKRMSKLSKVMNHDDKVEPIKDVDIPITELAASDDDSEPSADIFD